jgi:hypothetical protein
LRGSGDVEPVVLSVEFKQEIDCSCGFETAVVDREEGCFGEKEGWQMREVSFDALQTAKGEFNQKTASFCVLPALAGLFSSAWCTVEQLFVLSVDLFSRVGEIDQDLFRVIAEQGQVEQNSEGEGRVLLEASRKISNDILSVKLVLMFHEVFGPPCLPGLQEHCDPYQREEESIDELLSKASKSHLLNNQFIFVSRLF